MTSGRRRTFTCVALTALALAAALPVAAGAQAYPANYVFGDSLSDQGNLAELLGHNFPSPPYYQDSYTNGPVAVSVLAQRLGVSSDPSLFVTNFTDAHGLNLAPGTNYAVAGATAGTLAGVPGYNLPNQISAYLGHSGGQAMASALYTIFIGGNDVRTAAHSSSAGTAGALLASGEAAELAALTTLYGAGARNFLVVNVPDIGGIPEFTIGYPGQVSAASADTTAYNLGIAADVSAFLGTSKDAKVTLFDLNGFQKSIIADPAALGITNITQPCYASSSNAAGAKPVTTPLCGAIDPATGQPANIDRFAFWDYIHPTRVVQAAVGNALADAVLASAVPEPGTWATLVLGIGAIGTATRRRRTRATGAALPA